MDSLGRTYEELDLMFAAKVPTRKFSRYQIDAYDSAAYQGRAAPAKAKSEGANEILIDFNLF